jgi:hypothetical protein
MAQKLTAIAAINPDLGLDLEWLTPMLDVDGPACSTTPSRHCRVLWASHQFRRIASAVAGR